MPNSKKTFTPEPIINKLYRSENDKMIAGVAGGLGEYLNIDSSIIRILFVIITLLGGSGILLYLILWIILPAQSKQEATANDNIKNNVQEMKEKAQSLAQEVRHGSHNNTSRTWFGIIIIVIGTVFLLENLGIIEPFTIKKFWPLILVIFGLAIFLKNEKKH